MAKLTFKAGATFTLSGMLTLPTSAWSARVALFDLRNPTRPASDFGIAVDMTRVGTSASDPSRSDYVFVLRASAAQTALWPVKGPADRLTLEGDLILTDGIGQVVPTARRFSIEVRA